MALQKILRGIIIAGIFIIPFAPLVVTGSLFFPFISGKNFYFRIVVEIIVAAWALLAVINPAYRPKKNLLFWALTAFTIIILLADIFGVYFFKSFWSNFERMEGFVALIHLVLYTIVAWATLKPKTWEALLQMNLFVSFIIAIYGFVQLGGGATIHQGGTRLDASLGNATYLAVYMLFNIFFALFLALRQRGWWGRSMYLASALINTIILYHTATRGALLGLIGGIFLSGLLIALFERNNKRLRTISIGVVAASVLIVGLFFGIKNTAFVQNSPVLSRFASISLTERTTQSRFLIWNMALQGLKERPVLGWGQENFNYVFNKYYDPRMYNQEQWFDRTHNVILDWAIAGGILGLLSYLSIFGTALYMLWKKTNLTRAEKSVLTGLGAGYVVHNLFVFDNLTSYILFFTVLGFIGAMSQVKSSGETQARDTKEPWTLPEPAHMAGAVVTAVLFIAVLYFVNIPAVQAGTKVIKAITPGTSGEQKLDIFKDALSPYTLGGAEIREQLVAMYASVMAANPPEATRQAYFEFVKGEIEDQLRRTPQDARYQLFAGNFYQVAGDPVKSLESMMKASELSPKKQSILFEIASIYANQRQFDKAIETAKYAYELDMSYEEARLVYATVAIYASKNDIANGLLKDLSPEKLTDQRLINAYTATKQFNVLQRLFEEQVAKDPNNVQLRISLTGVYLQLNIRQKAIEQLQKIAELSPEYKETAEAYIEQIRQGKNPATGQ
jgi:O-antigen ligase/tetratricopeptide (TPR) repeat protein